ncbi:hypothetical protein EGI22_20390 [Lacihabitans sp. LS3-19]|uniref:hypothetical protein n=1 Tax=Lacihabitans sp. LS3-19 TaxID=2487335 RepID=UPI0020CEA878|nr:hypothetical protein [Lacihabitans sp. LS3-19]MCP9770271.1 hypothetical protein [Lacihabitans sp. LS3-19]
MRKFYKILFFVGIVSFSHAQMAAVEATEPIASRDPVKFTHIPFLLLRFNPTALFGYNNTLQYGAELAPPFGKFSFSFDYGKGKGSGNFNKYVKKNQAENLNKEFRGEIKMYFSDWFPFYALDKKPFGRYYSIEYVQGQYDRTVDMATGVGGTTLPSFAKFENVAYTEKTQAVHLKFGKHIHLHKHLFLDAYAGLGMGKYTSIDAAASTDDLENVPLHFGFLSNKSLRQPGTKGLYFSKTAGIRIAIPL